MIRIKLNKNNFVIWLTGLSGSGKTTIANELKNRLLEKRILAYVLDGDKIRTGLNKDLGFSESDRIENIRRIAEVANLFIDAGIIVIVASISPFMKSRDMARNLVNGKFIEVYVDCSINECIKRDPKGLYKKVFQGKIKEFTGISSPYEVPKNPEIVVKTDSESIDESVNKILYLIINNKLDDFKE